MRLLPGKVGGIRHIMEALCTRTAFPIGGGWWHIWWALVLKLRFWPGKVGGILNITQRGLVLKLRHLSGFGTGFVLSTGNVYGRRIQTTDTSLIRRLRSSRRSLDTANKKKEKKRTR